MNRALALTLVFAALGGCGQAQDDMPSSPSNQSVETSSASPATASGARPASFAICGTCHAVEAGRNGIGPSLFAVVGRAAGSVPGFNYSPAMKTGTMVWTEEVLDRFIAAPRDVVPGTKMAYAGNRDAAKRREIITYLAMLK